MCGQKLDTTVPPLSHYCLDFDHTRTTWHSFCAKEGERSNKSLSVSIYFGHYNCPWHNTYLLPSFKSCHVFFSKFIFKYVSQNIFNFKITDFNNQNLALLQKSEKTLFKSVAQESGGFFAYND